MDSKTISNKKALEVPEGTKQKKQKNAMNWGEGVEVDSGEKKTLGRRLTELSPK